jgi:hypothetical protein
MESSGGLASRKGRKSMTSGMYRVFFKIHYQFNRANGPGLYQPSPTGWVKGYNGFKG